MAMRDLADASRGAAGAAIEARHLGVQPGLVDEDEAVDVDKALKAAPMAAQGGDVRPLLFGRAQAFF